MGVRGPARGEGGTPLDLGTSASSLCKKPRVRGGRDGNPVWGRAEGKLDGVRWSVKCKDPPTPRTPPPLGFSVRPCRRPECSLPEAHPTSLLRAVALGFIFR